MLTNEFVTNKLAHFMEVPVPEGVFVEMDEQFLTINPSVKQICNPPVSTGLHFGTVRVVGVYQGPPASVVNKIANKASVAGIIVLDILTRNSDRKMEHCLLVSPDFAPAQMYLSAIDHGHCFGSPNWDESTTKAIGQHYGIMADLKNCVQERKTFDPYIQKLGSLSEETVSQIISQIPAEWNLPLNHRDALKEFIMGQKDKMASILEKEFPV